MFNKPQPWFANWYLDFCAINLVPLLAMILALCGIWPFQGEWDNSLTILVAFIIWFDWTHIQAHWFRILGNRAEQKKTKIIHSLSFLLFIVINVTLYHLGYSKWLEIFLVYFAAFHFMRQQYGLIRVYTKGDIDKKKYETHLEYILFQLVMITPLILWHTIPPYTNFYWSRIFFKSYLFTWIYYVLLGFTVLTMIAYIVLETKRTLRTQNFNIPKNLTLFTTAIGWGVLTFFKQPHLLVYFTVIIAHDVSYLFLVWWFARRDEILLKKRIASFSWVSVKGFVLYYGFLAIFSELLFIVHWQIVQPDMTPKFFGNLFAFIPHSADGIMRSFGMTLVFSVQFHHYFTDRFLWKKEKDLLYLINTGQYSTELKRNE